MAKGGWTRIMNRVDKTNAFNKSWSDYKYGFGDINGNHWLGFNSINKILLTGDFMARFEFENSQFYYFEVDLIKIGSESQNFILTLGQVTSYTIKTNLAYNNGCEFHTFDHNPGSSNCPIQYQAGWWFNQCYCFCSTCAPLTNEGHFAVNCDGTKWKNFNKFKIFIKRKYFYL